MSTEPLSLALADDCKPLSPTEIDRVVDYVFVHRKKAISCHYEGQYMSEPVIQLLSTSRLRRGVLGDCRWKMRTFGERDAYVVYDFDGGYTNPSFDLTNEHHSTR